MRQQKGHSAHGYRVPDQPVSAADLLVREQPAWGVSQEGLQRRRVQNVRRDNYRAGNQLQLFWNIRDPFPLDRVATSVLVTGVTIQNTVWPLHAGASRRRH